MGVEFPYDCFDKCCFRRDMSTSNRHFDALYLSKLSAIIIDLFDVIDDDCSNPIYPLKGNKLSQHFIVIQLKLFFHNDFDNCTQRSISIGVLFNLYGHVDVDMHSLLFCICCFFFFYSKIFSGKKSFW